MITLVVLAIFLALLVLGLVAAWWAKRFASHRRERHVRVDDLTRRYVVWLPGEYRKKEPLPVVLAFHGGFGRPESLEESAALHEADTARDFVIVYPEGYQKSWNAGACCGPAMEHKVNERKFVRGVLDDLESLVRIDRRRVYATGFSNGALLCYFLAATMSDEIAAIAPVGGAMLLPDPAPLPTRPVPVFHWHGLEDRFAPYEGGMSVVKTAPCQAPVEEGIRFWSMFNGTCTQSREAVFGEGIDCIVHGGGRDGSRVQLCRVAGLGHQWPGSQPTGQYAKVAAMFGPLGPPVDANGAIFEFFNEYALPPAEVG